MKLKPLGNRVLLKPIEVEQKTKSGIYIPESAKEKPKQAEVLAVGDGKLVNVKVGDKVIYSDFGGSDIELDGVKHIVMDIKDILAIVN